MSRPSIRAVAAEDGITAPGPRRDVPGSRRLDAALLLLPPLLVCAVAVLVPPLTAAQTPVATEAPHVWLGPDGAPLPFQNDDEVLEFLRTAEVVSRRTLTEGINREQKLLLEGNGVRAHAVFRTVDRELRRTRRPDGRYYVRWVDHYAGECAAYELALRLGLRFVPPAVPRRLGSTDGSLQIWIEGARDENAPDFRLPSPMAWVKQQWDMTFFDNLILNVDRNASNFLADPDYRLWVYDHGRAFQPKAELLDPGALDKINRTAWDRLQSMSDEELKDVVREHLDVDQLVALVERRALLAEHVLALVDEHGEGAVFY
jgi:hypothetical protein